MKKNFFVGSLLIIIFLIGIFLFNHNSKSSPDEIFNNFSIDKDKAEEQYKMTSEKDKNIIDSYIINDINNIEKTFLNNNLSLADAYQELSKYSNIDNTKIDLENTEKKITVINESNNNYKNAKLELEKELSYTTLENAIKFYEGVDGISEHLHESQNEIKNLKEKLLEFSKNNKISTMENTNLIEFFKETTPERIIREFNVGIVKEKYIYGDDKYLLFENENLVEHNLN